MSDDMMQNSYLLAALGQIDDRALEAINNACVHGEILKNEDLSPVLDTDGNRLVRDSIYLYRGKRCRITDWKFGSGNFMDTYYWVWYIDESLETQRTTIDAVYNKSDFSRVYKSRFSKEANNA